MATIEQAGFLKYKDAEGNTNLLLPITTKDNVDGMEEVDGHIADASIHFTYAEKAALNARLNELQIKVDSRPNWDENDPSSNAYIYNRPFYTEEYFYPENTNTYSAASISNNIVTFDIGSEFVFVESAPYEISIHSPEFEVTEIVYPDSDMHAYGSSYSLDIDNGTLTTVLPVEVSECDITISSGIMEYYDHKIDPRYLPDMQSAQPDWFENDESSPSYIHNRTHYEVYTTGIECSFTDLSFSEYGQNEDGEVVYSASGADPEFIIEHGGTYILRYPEESVACVAYYCDGYGLDDSFNELLYIGNIGIITYSGYDSGESYLIITDGSTGEYTVYTRLTEPASEISITAEGHTVYPLDERFIPDSIARTYNYYDIPTIDSMFSNYYDMPTIDSMISNHTQVLTATDDGNGNVYLSI